MYIVKCTIKKAIYDSRYVITGNSNGTERYY